MSSKVHRKQAYDTDVLMINTWTSMARDFSSTVGMDLGRGRLQGEHIRTFRLTPWPSVCQAPVYIHKRVVQLRDFFKRYTFLNDVYTPQQLEELTNRKFLDTQLRVAATPIVRSESLHRVLQRARVICKGILGRFDHDELLKSCQFGKKATVGNPHAKSYMDLKLTEGCTGSSKHIEWFINDYLPTDAFLSEFFGRSPGKDCAIEMCDSLALTNVPKSWKSLRTIMPNTTIGSFYTAGVGNLLTKRLKEAGLDISKLQETHKHLAKQYSRTRKGVTADLSAASDSFASDTVNMLLPRDWFKACSRGRITNVTIDGMSYKTATYAGMGIGFTFPLQTLCFYSLLKAIADLLGVKGRISVYGDDLIYPREMHSYVKSVFPKLRFQLNVDKTFCWDFFRESCGGDFYHGADVRPYNPEGTHRMLHRSGYLTLLYKIINGLRRRWDECEIPTTLHFLFREVLRVSRVIHQVPPSYPDTSGVKVDRPQGHWYIPWAKVRAVSTSLAFTCIMESTDGRAVIQQHAYYWETLRLMSLRDTEHQIDIPYSDIISCSYEKNDVWCVFRKDFLRISPNPILNWIDFKSYDRKKGGKPVTRLIATVSKKGSTKYVVQPSSVVNWT